MGIKIIFVYIFIFLCPFIFFPNVTLGYTSFYGSEGSSFSSYDIGDTTFFSGDVTGSAYNIGGTRFYNLGDSNVTAYNIGDTTFYSGDVTGSSYKIGDTGFHNIGNSNFSSYNIGDTTFYSGDISGSAYTIGGTTFYNTNQEKRNDSYIPTSALKINSYNPPLIPRQSQTYYYNYQNFYKNNDGEVTSSELTVKDVNTVQNRGELVPNAPNAKFVDYSYKQAESQENGSVRILSVEALGGGKVRVTWNKLDKEALSYTVNYGPSSDHYDFSTPGSDNNSVEVGGLPLGAKFYFTVQAGWHGKDGNGRWEWQNTKRGNEISVVVK